MIMSGTLFTFAARMFNPLKFSAMDKLIEN